MDGERVVPLPDTTEFEGSEIQLRKVGLRSTHEVC